MMENPWQAGVLGSSGSSRPRSSSECPSFGIAVAAGSIQSPSPSAILAPLSNPGSGGRYTSWTCSVHTSQKLTIMKLDFSGQTVRRRVNCNDAPAVAVAHRPRTNGPTRAWCSPRTRRAGRSAEPPTRDRGGFAGGEGRWCRRAHAAALRCGGVVGVGGPHQGRGRPPRPRRSFVNSGETSGELGVNSGLSRGRGTIGRPAMGIIHRSAIVSAAEFAPLVFATAFSAGE